MTPVDADAVHERWRVSWESALAALTSATVARVLATTEAEAHRLLIAAERELVTRELRLLAADRSDSSRSRDHRLGGGRIGLPDDVPAAAAS